MVLQGHVPHRENKSSHTPHKGWQIQGLIQGRVGVGPLGKAPKYNSCYTKDEHQL